MAIRSTLQLYVLGVRDRVCKRGDNTLCLALTVRADYSVVWGVISVYGIVILIIIIIYII